MPPLGDRSGISTAVESATLRPERPTRRLGSTGIDGTDDHSEPYRLNGVRDAQLVTHLRRLAAEQLRELITKGAVGWIAFQTEDTRALYETLRARGVTDFTQEPTDHFYGTDMGIRDPFGNAIRILQPKKVAFPSSPISRHSESTKCCASGAMSSGRSRSGGSSMGMTLRR